MCTRLLTLLEDFTLLKVRSARGEQTAFMHTPKEPSVTLTHTHIYVSLQSSQSDRWAWKLVCLIKCIKSNTHLLLRLHLLNKDEMILSAPSDYKDIEILPVFQSSCDRRALQCSNTKINKTLRNMRIAAPTLPEWMRNPTIVQPQCPHVEEIIGVHVLSNSVLTGDCVQLWGFQHSFHPHQARIL